MKSMLGVVVLLLSGCAAQFAAVGQTTEDVPVTGQLIAENKGGEGILSVNILSASYGTCSGSAKKDTITSILTRVPLKCSGGANGRADITSDYLNGRDIIDYRVGNERGRIISGLSLQTL